MTTATTSSRTAPPPAQTATAAPAATEDRNGVGGFLTRHRFGLRRLHSLTGVIFGGYVVVHLIVNATLLQSTIPFLFGVEGDVYQNQVDRIHDVPFLVAVEWLAIYLPLLFHALYGIAVAVSGRPNADRYSYHKNWAYTAQRVTSIILLFFIAFHVLSMKGVFGGAFGERLTFSPAYFATQTTINHMHAAWWVGWVVYPIGILAATFHLANGFWTAGITWGLTITRQAQRLWGFVCVGLFLFTTACAFGTLAATLAADPVDSAVIRAAQEKYRDPAAGAPLSPSAAILEAAEELKDNTGE